MSGRPRGLSHFEKNPMSKLGSKINAYCRFVAREHKILAFEAFYFLVRKFYSGVVRSAPKMEGTGGRSGRTGPADRVKITSKTRYFTDFEINWTFLHENSVLNVLKPSDIVIRVWMSNFLSGLPPPVQKAQIEKKTQMSTWNFKLGCFKFVPFLQTSDR